ncbi:SSPO protein, partial [Nothoprocta ornata]|nr:SSPO protein [Nothoprocta ornata]
GAAGRWHGGAQGTAVAAGVPCSGGQVHQECGRPCGQTCADLRLDGAGSCPDLEDTCVPGCNCPAGLVLDDGGQCVPP